mmetsp:Transcript_33957/g.76409  ORF Transcript_33957/g.76409 Transcript_33957/m.76409 type:complete len:208 (-) Transcript_33957:664-1287(-)
MSMATPTSQPRHVKSGPSPLAPLGDDRLADRVDERPPSPLPAGLRRRHDLRVRERHLPPYVVEVRDLHHVRHVVEELEGVLHGEAGLEEAPPVLLGLDLAVAADVASAGEVESHHATAVVEPVGVVAEERREEGTRRRPAGTVEGAVLPQPGAAVAAPGPPGAVKVVVDRVPRLGRVVDRAVPAGGLRGYDAVRSRRVGRPGRVDPL